MEKYICNVCGWIYDPSKGVPELNIPPGIAFQDLPNDFACPECGVGKDQFTVIKE
jgi:rubredoxin